ncbi:hypothetical protein HDR67_01515, partial [bacterium]|nr:hypothetical protein [bacterium]
KRVIEAYLQHTRIFYKEVAEKHANMFYEADCIQKDAWLIEKMRACDPLFLDR